MYLPHKLKLSSFEEISARGCDIVIAIHPYELNGSWKIQFVVSISTVKRCVREARGHKDQGSSGVAAYFGTVTNIMIGPMDKARFQRYLGRSASTSEIRAIILKPSAHAGADGSPNLTLEKKWRHSVREAIGAADRSCGGIRKILGRGSLEKEF